MDKLKLILDTIPKLTSEELNQILATLFDIGIKREGKEILLAVDAGGEAQKGRKSVGYIEPYQRSRLRGTKNDQRDAKADIRKSTYEQVEDGDGVLNMAKPTYEQIESGDTIYTL